MKQNYHRTRWKTPRDRHQLYLSEIYILMQYEMRNFKNGTFVDKQLGRVKILYFPKDINISFMKKKVVAYSGKKTRNHFL